MRCPCCQTRLITVKYEGFNVRHCEGCKGYLVRSGQVVGIKKKQEKTPAELAQEATDDVAVDGKNRQCPECGKMMTSKRRAGDAFFLDVCYDCKWTWFDGGELARSQEFAATISGDRPPPTEHCGKCDARFRFWHDGAGGSGTMDDTRFSVDVCPSCGARRPTENFWERIAYHFQVSSHLRTHVPPPEGEIVQATMIVVAASTAPAVLKAMCCVIAADGKITSSEKAEIASAFGRLQAPMTSDEIVNLIDSFVSDVGSRSYRTVFIEAVKELTAVRPQISDKESLVRELERVAAVDGEIDDRKRKVLDRFRAALEVE